MREWTNHDLSHNKLAKMFNEQKKINRKKWAILGQCTDGHNKMKQHNGED